MEKNKFYLGCHVSMNEKNKYLVGSVNEAICNNANTFMFYTGAPQNSKRADVEKLNVAEFKELLTKYDIDINKVVCHGPYIINLANSIKKSTFDLSVKLLYEELDRLSKIGVSLLVLHPGSSVGAERKKALNSLIKGLDLAYQQIPNCSVKVALETMSGKGSEVGINFEELKYILDNVKYKDKIGICFDTCHLHDAGYDLVNNFDQVIKQFDKLIGLEKLLVIHLNDSKNPLNSHKDRHQNIGYGHIGFETLAKFVHDDLFSKIPIILETPWIDNYCPYKEEINMLKNNKWEKIAKKEQLLANKI